MPETTSFRRIIESRRSIRKYLLQPVEREKIEACLEAARLAPSAENAQSWRFLVIDEPGAQSPVCRQGVFRDLCPDPVCGRGARSDPGFGQNRYSSPTGPGKPSRASRSTPSTSGSAASISSFRPRSWAWATCWIGWFDVRAARRFFKIPRRYKIVSLISLGYAARRPPNERVRKPLAEIAWWNRFEGLKPLFSACNRPGPGSKPGPGRKPPRP